jgi:hypothetical protein
VKVPIFGDSRLRGNDKEEVGNDKKAARNDRIVLAAMKIIIDDP